MHFSTFSIFSLLTSGCVGYYAANEVQSVFEAQKHAFTSKAIVDITQVLSLYGIALDLKKFSALDKVYTKDTVVDLGRGPIHGLDALEKYYKDSAGNTTTLHSSQNVYVFDVTETTATAYSDAIAVFFTPGHFIEGSTIPLLTANQTLNFYERFEDKFARGRDGLWRISNRKLTILAIVGDLSIEG